jgi:diguanylate cyclase (GGDEF)-like protein
MRPDRHTLIRALFDEYITMYAGRDDRLTGRFSENFSGCTGGGDFLVKDKAQWVAITRQDFAQVPEPLAIELLDLSLQDISEDVVITTAFFHIHLPIKDHILSKETARLILVFRDEGRTGDTQGWKIVSSTISIPYSLVQDGEVYPLKGLRSRNRELEDLVELRTRELAETNAKLEALSNTDSLTAIANRRNFDQMLAQEWNRALRTGTPLSLILLDVDHFKHYNDYYGHLAGDTCLKELAQALLRAERRAGRLVARYGGEEFVVLLPGVDESSALETARHIQQEVWALNLRHEDTPAGIVTVSLGVASILPTQLFLPEHLVRQADLALYCAKNKGRNCVQGATC